MGVSERTGSDGRVGFRAWLVVALLFPVALLNYLDRQMLATMRLSLSADFPALQGAAADLAE